MYQTLKTKILEKIKETSVEDKKHTTIKSTLKLPACEIQNFEGGYLRWPAFRHMFKAVIGKDTSVAPAQKLYYLRSKVRGRPTKP